jgi:hypothetical protein
MQYLVRRERSDFTPVEHFKARDMDTAVRKVQEWDPQVKLTSGQHFRYGFGVSTDFLYTILSQS